MNTYFPYEQDATFIAHARTALPAALDEIERLRAALTEADRALTCPAAEYVPAIAEAFTIIDAATKEAE